MTHCRMHFIALSVLLLALMGCASSDEPAGWQSYTSEALGLTFLLPDDWILEEESAEITFASQEELINAPVLADGGGGFVSVEPLAAYGGQEDPLAFMELIVAQFTADGSLKVVAPAEARDRNGQAAATVGLAGVLDGQAGTFLVTVLIAHDKLALMVSIDATGDDRYQETLLRIADSLTLN